MSNKLVIFDTGLIDNLNHTLCKILEKEYNTKVYYLYKDYNEFEDTFFLIKPIYILKEIITIKRFLKSNKIDKAIIRGGSLLYYCFLPSLLKNSCKTVEIILFKYDIDNFRSYLGSFSIKNMISNIYLYFNRLAEKRVMMKSDKIIHKGLENELEFLPFYEEIKDKLHYLFREFLDLEIVQDFYLENKLSANDNEIHIVYGGCIHETDSFYHERTTNLFKRIIHNSIHIHVYSRQVKEYQELMKSRFFHYEGFKKHKVLIREYSRYDFGLYFYGRTDNMFDVKGGNIWDITGFSNKIYDYILAGLPILYSRNLKAIAEFLDEHELGISGDYKSFDFSVLKKMHIKDYSEKRNKYLQNYSFRKFIKFMEM